MTFRIVETIRKYAGWCPDASGFPVPARTVKLSGEPHAGTAPGNPPGSTAGLAGKYGRIAVPVTAAACLLALTIVLKNILLMPADQLNRDIVLYIILYFGFIVSYPFFGKAKENLRAGSPAIWCGIILAATLAIIALYAV